MMETMQIIVGVAIVPAFIFCLWVAIREVIGLWRDIKDGGWL